MKAVNLMPPDERRRAPGSRSGALVYLVLGALGVVLVAALAYALAGKTINDRRAELADVRAQADAAQQHADALNAYTRFAQLRAERVQTVTSLVKGRFDWAHALHELSRVLPNDSWITSLKGSSTPTATPTATATTPSAGAPTTPAPSGPAIQMSGCTSSQQGVARVMARLRMIDGVAGVSVTSSTKSAGGTGTGGCGAGKPAFDLAITFRSPTAASPAPSTAQQGASR